MVCTLQLNVKKHFVYGAIAFIWIVIPACEITFVTSTTDIVKGKCIRFSAYHSETMRKSMGFFSLFVAYFLPLALMVFCYARIICTLRTKVTLLLQCEENSHCFVIVFHR